MRKDLLFGIGATVVAMALFYWMDHEPTAELVEQAADQTRPAVALSGDSSNSQETKKNSSALSKSTSSDPAKPDEMDEVYKKFSEHLKTVGTCLQIQNTVDHDRIDPTFDNLVVSLRPALGEFVVQMDDWNQRDVKAADGTVKRIRTEIDYQDTANPTKYLQLFNINAEGMPEMQTLDQEQAMNPSDAYIESLRGEATTVLEEKGGRVYYQEGEELVMIERNGKIESFSLNRNGKTVSCTGLDAVDSNCQCLE